MASSHQRLKAICVYCGSSSAVPSVYMQAAEQLARELVRRQSILIYGGGNLGSMGVLSRTVAQAGGRVIGIIPRALNNLPAHGDLSESIETVVVGTMHERKQQMSERADAFIALPGGFGSLEELTECITWSQLRIHCKPIGILNVNGYYDHIVAWMDRALADGFMDAASRQLVVVKSTVPELMQALDEFVDPLAGNAGYMLTADSCKLKADDI